MLIAFGMLGGWEIGLIIVVLLVLFGPSKLPQLGSGIGKAIRGFRKETKAMKEEWSGLAKDEITDFQGEMKNLKDEVNSLRKE